MRPWLAPAAVALVASAFPLLQVGSDRIGASHGTFELAQGELSLSYTSDENSMASLQWNWWGEGMQMDSVRDETIRTLGFRCDRATYECSFGHGERGWVAVAIDSMQWQRGVAKARTSVDSTWRSLPDSVRPKRRSELMGRMEQAYFEGNRLRIEAIGPDPARLAAQWNDGQHIILPARLSAWRLSWPRDTLPGATRWYRIDARPETPSLYVPSRWAGLLRDSTGYRRQLYRVGIEVGARWLPRVVEVTPIAPPATRADSLRLFGLDWQ